MFTYKGHNFCNIQNSKCLDVSGGKDVEGGNVLVWGRHNGLNQRWTIRYTDTVKEPPVTPKGKVDPESGLKNGIPFYIRSRLPMRRMATFANHSTFRINRWRKNDLKMQFFYDSKTKTVRSEQWKNYALEIYHNGKSDTMRLTASINGNHW
jgi:hypothetical protein